MAYCGYDYTNGASVNDFLQCVHDEDGVVEINSEMKILPDVPTQDVEQECKITKEKIPADEATDDSSNSDEEVQEEGFDVEDPNVATMALPKENGKPDKYCQCTTQICSRKSLFVLSSLLVCLMTVLLTAFIFHLQRNEFISEDFDRLRNSTSTSDLSIINAVPIDSCTLDGECLQGEICYGGYCIEHDVLSPTRETPKDDPCRSDSDCPSRICVGNSSQSYGICSDGKAGSICGVNTDCETNRCVRSLCMEKQIVGGGCKGNGECASGLCAGFSSINSGSCLDTSPSNTCQDDYGCGTHGTCAGGFCKNFRLQSGAVCTENSECLSGDCSWSRLQLEKRCG